MTTLPLLLNLAEELDSLTSRFYESDFGLGCPALRHYHHPALTLVPSTNRLIPRICGPVEGRSGALSLVGKDGFQVSMDVQNFDPKELTVKTIDNSIVIEGKHEEREDEHGFVSRHFVRRYVLPDGYDPSQIVSTLSSDGILTVKVPPPPKAETANERVIEIQHTGPARLSVKEGAQEEKKEDEQK